MAFHPYSQLIPGLFNVHEFGPPRSFTCASPWPRVDHRVSGLIPQTNALLRLAFATARFRLTLRVRITSRLIKQEARHQAFPYPKTRHSPLTACKHTVSGSISLPSQGCFSPFPHGTSSLSVANEYLALESGLPRFPRGFSCPVVLRIPLRVR